MNERIRLLREDKALSRAAFGEKLGVSGDVINNLERGRVEPKDHIIKLICAEYSVNEKWLLYKTGEAKPTKCALRNKGSGRASYKARRRSTSFTTF